MPFIKETYTSRVRRLTSLLSQSAFCVVGIQKCFLEMSIKCKMVILGLVDMRINNQNKFGGFIQNVPIILLSCLINVTSHDKSAGTGLPKFSVASSQISYLYSHVSYIEASLTRSAGLVHMLVMILTCCCKRLAAPFKFQNVIT